MIHLHKSSFIHAVKFDKVSLLERAVVLLEVGLFCSKFDTYTQIVW